MYICQNQIFRISMEFDYKIDKIAVAVDCVIFGFDQGKLKLLLVHRGFEPVMGLWSLMGGFVKLNEDVDQAASRILKELTGLENVYMDLLTVYGKVKRDPGGRVISILYSALIKIDEQNVDLVKQNNATWIDIDQVPKLIFDHNEMVQFALKRLRFYAKMNPIGFELLPAKFTLPDLQSLYEAIYDEPLDSRNFRKKILSMDILIKLDEKDTTTSKKGAFLYKFDVLKYKQQKENGIDFNLSKYLR